MSNELTTEERQALKDAGIEIKTYWAVVYPDNGMPAAIFEVKAWAEKFQKGLITCTVEPYNLQIKI